LFIPQPTEWQRIGDEIHALIAAIHPPGHLCRFAVYEHWRTLLKSVDLFSLLFSLRQIFDS
jgi:hypothetical protein